MKKLYSISVMSMVLTISCASSRETNRSIGNTRPDGAIVITNNSALSLADYLRRVPGVSVSGSGSNVSVNIHGPSSFMLSSEPLYVVDGQPVGGNYDAVNSIIDVHNIDYVKVLKGDEAAFYGVRGGNGVILINTKKN